MRKLLLIDDEIEILSSLEEMFKYESGLDIDVFTAKSARAAVELLEKIKFDVVMTDVKMPKMSGIQLYKIIKERWPKCRIIFLSGYRDFDDLYEINRTPDVRYLQKSEENDVLIAAVAEEFAKIESMLQEERKESEHQAKIRRAELILQKNTMREVFMDTGRIILTAEKLRQIRIPLYIDKELFIFFMKIDNFDRSLGMEAQINTEKVLDEIIKEFLPSRFERYLYSDSRGNSVLFLQPVYYQETVLSARDWNLLYKNLVGTLEYIQEKALSVASLSVSFITCDDRCLLKDGPAYFNRLKQEAVRKIGNNVQRIQEAESYTRIQGKAGAVMPENVQLQVKQLEDALDRKEFGYFAERLQNLTELLKIAGISYPVRSKELYYSIAVVINRTININRIKRKIERDIPLDDLLHFEMLASPEKAAEYLNRVGNRLIDELNTQTQSRTDDVLDKVVRYIREHLAENLTLTRLAELCYLNPSYLSRIFKQKYQCNLTEYITNARMEKANALLRTTSLKINEIASEAGYLSATAFTRVYKKVYGMSPIEYRDKYGDNNNEL